MPFLKEVLIPLGWFFLPFAMFVMIGASNAVNLTDGLDGLAIVPVMIAAGCFGFIAYLVGNVVFADYLQLHHVAGAGELAVFCGALVGAGLGFLWFNAPPAMVFMGDTGSLGDGRRARRHRASSPSTSWCSPSSAALFVLETVSVIVQVVSFKLTGQRVFRMAPLHHHFEKKGWAEPTIVIRFWIIAAILALVGLVHPEAAMRTDALVPQPIRIPDVAGKVVAVLGLGRSGLRDRGRARGERRDGVGVGRQREGRARRRGGRACRSSTSPAPTGRGPRRW